MWNGKVLSLLWIWEDDGFSDGYKWAEGARTGVDTRPVLLRILGEGEMYDTILYCMDGWDIYLCYLIYIDSTIPRTFFAVVIL